MIDPEPLHFPASDALKLLPYLPPPRRPSSPSTSAPRPFVTLTYATSLDAGLALAPGARTALSGAQSKAMTHFLRSRHAAICVGAGTAAVDDPGLNCRLAEAERHGPDDQGLGTQMQMQMQPRPIVLDPRARWAVSERSRVVALARAGRGLAPYVLTAVPEPPASRRAVLEACGGRYVVLEGVPCDETEGGGGGGGGVRFRWEDILAAVWREGLHSLMVEGGANVINELLAPPANALVDSVIVTVAPTWLGRGCVAVAPAPATDTVGNPAPAARLRDVAWYPLGEDVVLCGRILR